MLLFYSSVFLFFCFSFSGWLLETAAAAVRTHRYVDRSVLFGPLCIVYGVGGLMMVHLLGELRGNWWWNGSPATCWKPSPTPVGGIIPTIGGIWTAM